MVLSQIVFSIAFVCVLVCLGIFLFIEDKKRNKAIDLAKTKKEPAPTPTPIEYPMLNGRVILTQRQESDAIFTTSRISEEFQKTLDNLNTAEEIMIYAKSFSDTHNYNCTFFCNSEPKVSLREAVAVKKLMNALMTRMFEIVNNINIVKEKE